MGKPTWIENIAFTIGFLGFCGLAGATETGQGLVLSIALILIAALTFHIEKEVNRK